MSRLIPDEIRKALPPIYTNESKPVDEVIVITKFFSALGVGTWWITEFDGDDTCFGWVDIGMTYGVPEAGYISVSELENLHRGKMPIIERDLYWTPKTWKEALQEWKLTTGQ